jgi:hypothetical protein
VKNFQVSFTGEKMLYQQDDKWTIAEPPAMSDGPDGPPPKPGNEKALKTQDLEVKVDPPAEWKQMFREVWRIEREFFYDPHYHGLDLQAAEERYGVYLNGLAIARRSELPVHRDAGQHDGGPYVPGRRRPAGGQARTHWAARSGLQDRERTLPFRARLRRRELESRSESAADAARRERERGRISAGGEWARTARFRYRLQLLRGDRREDHAAESGAGSLGSECARSDGGAGGRRSRPAASGMD